VLPVFAPAGEALFLREKGPKPVTPHLASWEGTDASLRRADQLAEPVLRFLEGLKQGPPGHKSILPLGQTAGVRAGAMIHNAFPDRGFKP